MARYGMVIDLDRCIGCRACMVACKVENNTPPASLWMYVFRLEEGTYPDVRVSFLPRPCMHCANAPCVKVCPVGARFTRADGIVSTDWDRCIGCRYCEVACPYGVNYFNWKEPAKNQYLDWGDAPGAAGAGGAVPPYDNPHLDAPHGPERRRIAGGGQRKGVVEKCTFCVQRVDRGLTTACAAACPTSAIVFGDLGDPNSPPSQLLRSKRSFRLLEERGTQPQVHYVGGRPPSSASREIEAVRARV